MCQLNSCFFSPQLVFSTNSNVSISIFVFPRYLFLFWRINLKLKPYKDIMKWWWQWWQGGDTKDETTTTTTTTTEYERKSWEWGRSGPGPWGQFRAKAVQAATGTELELSEAKQPQAWTPARGRRSSGGYIKPLHFLLLAH